MSVLSDYVAGTASITTGTKIVTGTGTGWLSADFREGDLFYRDSFVAVIASVESETQVTLVDNWGGPTLTNATYRIRYMGDGERVSAQARTLIEKLGNGNIQAFAGLVGENNTLPMFTGPGSMVLKPLAEVMAGLTPRGAYNAGTTYAKGDWVSYGGNSFVSRAAGNVGNTPPATATDNASWMYIPTVAGAAGTNGKSLTPRGVWSNATTYDIADYVSFGINTFASKQAGNLNHQPPSTQVDDAYWQVVPYLMLEALGAYSAGTTYGRLDFVSYNGRNFVSKVDSNIGNTPPNSATDNTQWAFMPSGPTGPGLTPRGAYNAGTTYAKGDVVAYSGNTFTSFLDGNVGNTPPATAVDNANWMYLPSGGGTTVPDGDKGDITVSGSGTVWTVDNDAITYAKMQNVSATARILGRKTTGAGDVEEMTLSDVLNMIGSAAEGDILYRGATQWQRLPKGTARQYLKQNTALTAPEWVTVVEREVLTANRTYYVRTDGNDTNSGLTNTVGGAFLTIQKAVNVVSSLDLTTFNVTIQVADGTYTGPVVCNGAWLGSGIVTLQGNSGTPANVLISVTSNDAISVSNNAALTVKDLKLSTTTGGFGMLAKFGGFIEYTNLDFGACASSQIRASEGGIIQAAGNYTISGGGAAHWDATGAGSGIRCQFRTITITGTPAFVSSFAQANLDGTAILNGNVFSGSATGKRFNAANMGTVFTSGAGASYFPGDVAGTGTVPNTSPYGLYV